MSAPGQGSGGSGGSSGEAGSIARRRWEMMRAGAPAGVASRHGVDAARRGLKARNALTALAIGAVVVGILSIDGYTFYSVSQEHFLDELELEAKAVRAQAAKTSGN